MMVPELNFLVVNHFPMKTMHMKIQIYINVLESLEFKSASQWHNLVDFLTSNNPFSHGKITLGPVTSSRTLHASWHDRSWAPCAIGAQGEKRATEKKKNVSRSRLVAPKSEFP